MHPAVTTENEEPSESDICRVVLLIGTRELFPDLEARMPSTQMRTDSPARIVWVREKVVNSPLPLRDCERLYAVRPPTRTLV